MLSLGLACSTMALCGEKKKKRHLREKSLATVWRQSCVNVSSLMDMEIPRPAVEVKFSRTFVGVRGKRRRVAYAFFSGVIEICHTGDGKERVVTLDTARSLWCWPLRCSHGGRSGGPGCRWQPPSRERAALEYVKRARSRGTMHAVCFRPPMPDAVRKSMSQGRLQRCL